MRLVDEERDGERAPLRLRQLVESSRRRIGEQIAECSVRQLNLGDARPARQHRVQRLVRRRDPRPPQRRLPDASLTVDRQRDVAAGPQEISDDRQFLVPADDRVHRAHVRRP
jgi:hypothetical protein